MRTTKAHLTGSLRTLNEILGRPVDEYVDGKPQTGCISYEHWGNSVFITEMEGSASRRISDSGTLKEAHQWVCAAIKGVQLTQGKNLDF